MLARGTKIVYIRVSVLLTSTYICTSTSLKIKRLKLAESTRETEHRSAMHSAPSTEV